MNKRNLLSLVAVAVFTTFAVGTVGGDDSDESRSEPAAAATAEPAGGGGKEKPAKQAKPVSMGEEFRVGDFTYNITKVSTANRVGSRYVKAEPSKGATFVVVHYSERNEGDETHTGLGSPIKFQDPNGRKFKSTSKAQSALAAAENIDLFPQLQPGVVHESVAVFEVPSESATDDGQLIVEERGVLGSKEQLVDIDFDDEA